MVGAVAGTGILIAGVAGTAVGLIAIILAVWPPPRATAIGGVLLGLGGAWLALFGRAAMSCRDDCRAPDLMSWLAVAVGLAVLGAVVSAWASRRPG